MNTDTKSGAAPAADAAKAAEKNTPAEEKKAENLPPPGANAETPKTEKKEETP